MADSGGAGRASPARREHGVALVAALTSITLLMVLGVSLVLLTLTETRVSSAYRDAVEVHYATDGALDLAMADLRSAPDVDAVLAGVARSGFADGPPSGVRMLRGGVEIRLSEMTNALRCGKTSACTDAEMNESTAVRPWGANNPRWQLYAYGPLGLLRPIEAPDTAVYVAVWIGDDPSENDGDPSRDGPLESNPGRGVVSLHAEAVGARGERRVIETIVERLAHGLRVHSWKELR